MPNLYSDPLITINEDGLRVQNASLFTDKTIRWDEIEEIRAVLPTLWTGRFKISGTSDFRTWMATDS